MYRVLLVDDEPAILEAENRNINMKIPDFRVVGEAYSVEQGIKKFEELSPDVVLCDMKMPGKSGIELIKHIYEKEECLTVVIAVSGYSDFEYVHDAFMYGAYEYLLKPVEPKKMQELFVKIRKVLQEVRKNKKEEKLVPSKLSGSELLKEIDAYLDEHLSEDNSIVQMCSRFAISQPYLSRIFKKYKGCTYNEYVIGAKIKKGKKFLEEGDYLIGEISDILGFADQFYFSRVFKRETGYTPREYKNHCKTQIEDSEKKV